ncbi:TetR family transcriptional regulator protein [Rhizobium etli bv. mimosae str. Mim1]|nr:TetR family transcriptional regulator protein [Rhizobium etli bv. mimosae str. Mim1]
MCSPRGRSLEACAAALLLASWRDARCGAKSGRGRNDAGRGAWLRAFVGALRLAVDRWAEEQGRKSLADYVSETFAYLRAELANA